jgi:hypothetical protein
MWSNSHSLQLCGNKLIIMKLTEEQKQFIEANKTTWLQAPGMSVTDMQMLLTGTKEELYQWLQSKKDIVGKARVETPWNQKLYTNLEDILEDLRQQKRHLTIMTKLQETINSGAFIQTDGTK